MWNFEEYRCSYFEHLENELRAAPALNPELYCRPCNVSVEQWGDEWRVMWNFRKCGKPTPNLLPKAHLQLIYGDLWNKDASRDDLTGEIVVAPQSERAASNVSRARSRVRELAACNEWQYFATLTLDEGKQDRFDRKAWKRALGVWIGNYNKKFGTNLRYLIVPERHKNGAWHAHGLFAGLAVESLVRNEYGYLDMPYYAQRFGFISLDPIRDKSRCASYIAKYVTKEYANADFLDKGERMFYSSQGLQGKRTYVRKAGLYPSGTEWENEYCAVRWCKSMEEAYSFI